jgi:hypothetical protein
MRVDSRYWRLLLLLVVAVSLVALTAPGVAAKPPKDTGQVTVSGVESLGVVTFPTFTMFGGTEVGGLSGITYDAHRGGYYALSDDRSQFGPARYYTVDIDLSDGSLDDGDVTFVDVTFLRDQTGSLFEPRSLDPEGINLARNGQLFISSEGAATADPVIDPFVNRFNLPGKQNRALAVPDKFLPDGTGSFGVRDNLAFESLTSTPDQKYLYTATENALVQDGPRSTLTSTSPSRVLEYSLAGKRPGAEYVYVVEKIPTPPDPPGAFADNGLVELQALDNAGTFLAMERSFAVGVGNTVRLFETSTTGASDVSGISTLVGTETPMSKALVADFANDLGIDPDNLEGMTLGPMLPDGRVVLIVVSDNNFNPAQITQFIALAVELEPAT